LQISDQVVFVFHLSNTVSQGNSDGKRKAFWDGDDNDTDSDNKSFNKLVKGVQSEQIAHKITRSVSSKQDMTQHADEGQSS
jgi:hypothetical protein